MNLRKPVYVIIIFWALIIGFSIISNEIVLGSKTTVYLKTVPVDPRDLLMGDYVILNYEIAQNPGRYKNENVYVSLYVDENNIAHKKDISTDKPQNELYMKGKIGECSFRKCIKFGIESYYVKEGEGHKLERDLREGALVEVAISKNGRAKVKGFKKD